MVNACVVLLMVGVVSVFYLPYGAVLFGIAIGASATYGTHTVYVRWLDSTQGNTQVAWSPWAHPV